MHTILALCTETAWENFRALEGSWLGQALPACAGLYRIRLVEAGQSRVVYIGQSGNLKERIGGLRAIYRQFMPYRAPHTAAPFPSFVFFSREQAPFCAQRSLLKLCASSLYHSCLRQA